MKSIRTKVIFKGVALMAFAFFGTQAIAQEENREKEDHKPPTYAQLLKKMDANNDGKLAKSEAKGHLTKHFDKVDANKDGFISKTEFKNAPRPKRDGQKPPRKDGADCTKSKCTK